ncbi:uncharacterized protein LTR77_006785 [Saxophila tyrrhenica]|uniref:Uncharacterized protein n=1 Tax=Saxophila tyrrhenica TaxID=1690608 RepID=A0AAV9P6C7_9PEZI|nr:hypothetical protein LTR77_006785 [Saxophila tyrrhenica]
MSEGKYGSVLYPNHTYKAVRVEAESYGYLYVVWCSGEHELYDTKADPYQLNNLYQTDHSAHFNAYLDSAEHAQAEPLLMAEPVSVSNTSAYRKRQNDAEAVASGATVARLTLRLDALLLVLKTCSGRQCTHPWETLFPRGEVQSLADALDQRYEDFFETQVDTVQFEKCEKGYIAESEGPVWSGSQVYGMNHEMAFE